jgi:hypothetical protein
MTPVMIVLVPVLVLAVVLVFAFAGCGLDAMGVPGPEQTGTVTGGPLTIPDPTQIPSSPLLVGLVKPYHQRIEEDARLRHYWRLNDSFSHADPIVHDSAPVNQINGLCRPLIPNDPQHITRWPISGWVGSDFDVAAAFDGIGYVEVPYDFSLNPPYEFTVEAWVNPDAALQTTPMAIVSSFKPSIEGGFRLDLLHSAGKDMAQATISGTVVTQLTVPLQGSNVGWYYVAMTYSASNRTLSLYVVCNTYDNVNTKSDTPTFANDPVPYVPVAPSSGAPLRIGGSDDVQRQWFFKGLMCNVALYDKALTENDAMDRFVWGTTQ